ncbi:uncharacterized protein LOC110117595 isoform X2 [Ceratitis capitata]|uniref:(Mediterranean fruit fly) hypothetical protein n=1 Tax=Ceratitis capitata TaxID=7213 RepID=A0A811VIH2_CERCA|nr:uncharacterized protein LOC110117595 isoform X2 [Ceratitis capitata]CAD7015047.1 unnamed protein product [Ceratitis capitata]
MSTHCIYYLKILTFIVLFSESYVDCELSVKRNETSPSRWQNLVKQKDSALQLVKPYVQITVKDDPPKCVQLRCKIICRGHKGEQLDESIKNALLVDSNCTQLTELRLYDIEFTNQTISAGFLGEYSQKVHSLYIGSSNVTHIAAGAFGMGNFKAIFLENLQLEELRKDIFKNATLVFKHLSIIQHNKPVTVICDDFLGHIKYQIESFTLQVGATHITNTTASSSLLNNLKYVDISYNNFTNTFTDETFQKMWVVEHLDLSHSNINFLPLYLFSQLTDSLFYLNLSYNQLFTISRYIFGRHAIDDELIIDASNNPWDCSCSLLLEMSYILAHQKIFPYCHGPEEYTGLSVLDLRLCYDDYNITTTSANVSTQHEMSPTTPKMITTRMQIDIDYISTKEPSSTAAPTQKTSTTSSEDSNDDDDEIMLRCLSSTQERVVTWQKVLWPETEIQLTQLSQLRVEVTVNTNSSHDSFGLIWFSKVIDDYYSMTVNYDQYGLGCVGPISYATTIGALLPDTTYTFCLVADKKLTISPFHCDSLHMSSNLGIVYNAWLSYDMRATGISLTIFGIVLSCFLGITGVFMLFKHNPRLLKGSKRVKTTGKNSIDIVIFPREHSLESLKIKEEGLANRHSRSTFDTITTTASFTSHTNTSTNNHVIRRGSDISIESNRSNQSYMNANLYEVIPAYLRLQDVSSADCAQHSVDFESINSYMSTLAPHYTECQDASLVSYAEVAPRRKRTSNDPLPALPTDRVEVRSTSSGSTIAEEDIPGLVLESMPYITVTDTTVDEESKNGGE